MRKRFKSTRTGSLALLYNKTIIAAEIEKFCVFASNLFNMLLRLRLPKKVIGEKRESERRQYQEGRRDNVSPPEGRRSCGGGLFCTCICTLASPFCTSFWSREASRCLRTAKFPRKRPLPRQPTEHIDFAYRPNILLPIAVAC